MRPYQKDGFNWLVNNSRNGFGSLLADDMGWGKTIQVLAFLLPSKKYHVINGPALVVVPTTLISNWLAEVKKWAPSLRVHVAVGRLRKFLACATPERVAAAAAAAALPVRRRLAGKQQNPENAVQTPKPKKQRLSVSSTPAAKRAASTAAAFKTPMKVHGTDKRKRSTKLKPKQADVQFEEKDADIFLTSYWTFLQDADKLIASPKFGAIMCDESQYIKNYRSQIGRKAKDVAEMVGDVRIAISGTPVENSVRDLGSMFDFILPGYLTSTRAAFERDFVKPNEGSADRKISKAERQAQEEQPSDGEEAEKEGAGKQADDPEKQEEDVATERRQLLNRMKDPFLRRVKTDKKVAPDLPGEDLPARRFRAEGAAAARSVQGIGEESVGQYQRCKPTRLPQVCTGERCFRGNACLQASLQPSGQFESGIEPAWLRERPQHHARRELGSQRQVS